jgi:hypothetical protein
VGTAPGALVGAGLGLLAGFVPGLLVGALIGAAIGAFVGVACGLTGGLSLIIFRQHIGGSRCAIGAVAGCGAGLVPATWLIAFATSSGRLAMPAALTVVTVVLAAAVGRRAFYGKPRSGRQQPHWTSRVERQP